MKPLEGIRVLAVSQYGAGPYGTVHLADLGAEVIKIEDRQTGGDVSRSVVPYAEDGDSLYFQALNRNKKSISLNLRQARGREIFRRLAACSHAVFNNLRGDVPEKLGLVYSQLCDVNPAIVTCSLSGFGASGSRRSEPAYDYLLQAMMGHMDLTGEPGGQPQKFGLSIIDFATGILAAFAILAGIHRAKESGAGCDLDVSMFDLSASLLNYLAAWNLNRGYIPRRHADSAHPSLVPSQMFRTSDGHLVIMCNKEKFFPVLCHELGLPEVAADPRFADFPSRLEHRDALVRILAARLITQTTSHWIGILSGHVPVAPVLSVDEALRQPLMAERDLIAEVEHPHWGALRMIGCPVKVSGYSPEYAAAPALGQHNQEIYGGLLGMSGDQIRQLEQEGTI